MFTVRPATAQDAPIIAGHRYPELGQDHPALPRYAAWVGDALTRGVYLGWLAERQGAVVGGAGLTLLEWGPTRDDPSPVRARVVNVFTAPEWRRQGVARTLLEEALRAAQMRGIRTLNLGTTEQARSLYEELGFSASPHEMLRRAGR